jgi:hypothetical protein
LRPSAPQAGASANSATSALGGPVVLHFERHSPPGGRRVPNSCAPEKIQFHRRCDLRYCDRTLFRSALRYFKGSRYLLLLGKLGVRAGDFGAGADLPGADSRTEPEECRVAQTAKVTDVHMKIPASAQVILASVVTAPRGPKAAWLTPPKAAVISTFSPPWISTIAIIRMLTRMCIATIAVINLSPVLQACCPTTISLLSKHYRGRPSYRQLQNETLPLTCNSRYLRRNRRASLRHLPTPRRSLPAPSRP